MTNTNTKARPKTGEHKSKERLLQSKFEKKVIIPTRFPKAIDVPVIGIDCEYYRKPDPTPETDSDTDPKENIVLSYQFFLIYKGETTKLILYPPSPKKRDRLRFDRCLVRLFDKAIEQKSLASYPEHVIICGHFLRADIFNFNNAFKEFGAHLDPLRKTVLSGADPYGVDLEAVHTTSVDKAPIKIYDRSRNPKFVQIRFFDTMLLAPNGRGLADIGELVGLPKLAIPDTYSIERMDEYLRKDKPGFEAYAMRDAEITAKYMVKIIEICSSINIHQAPKTIGGLAVKAFINSLPAPAAYQSLFGFKEVTREIWDKNRARPHTIKQCIPTPEREILENIATLSYHGGRNESFMMGPTSVDLWNDYDAPSCYTACQLGIRELDYAQAKQSRNVEDFFGDCCSMARVKFRFPDDTRFPSIPVRAGERGLVYPLSGETFCTGHELEVAYQSGAQIEIISGFIIPWLDDVRIFEPYMSWIREKRTSVEKGSFDELLYKEMGNSLYGKLAQGLRGKSVFDIGSGLSKTLPPSRITNPYYATYVTGLARALMSEMINAVPTDKSVVSVTTDGFLTNATIDEIDLDGPICQRFRDLFHRIDKNKGPILERKHGAEQLINMKTRGQLTAKKHDGSNEVLAKAGVKPPYPTKDHNAFMVDLYLNRTPETRTDSSHLISTREMFMDRRDLINITADQRLNLEFDWKRKLQEPRMIDVNGYPHISCESVPHDSVEEMLAQRVRFDNWRGRNCLKNLEDWASFEDFDAMSRCLNSTGLRVKADESSDQLLVRMFIRCYAQKCLGLTSTEFTAKALAGYFSDKGYSINQNTVRGAKKAKLVLETVPVTQRALGLLVTLLNDFPSFEYQSLFKNWLNKDETTLQGLIMS